MKIEELDDGAESIIESNHSRTSSHSETRMIAVRVDAKRALVGAGARILFYPTLLYNVFRNKIQAEFRWWDQIDQVWLAGLSKLIALFIYFLNSISFLVNMILDNYSVQFIIIFFLGDSSQLNSTLFLDGSHMILKL